LETEISLKKMRVSK
jgi:hypothetical protein